MAWRWIAPSALALILLIATAWRIGGPCLALYYGNRYSPSADYWRLGAVFGLIVFAVIIFVTVALLLATG